LIQRYAGDSWLEGKFATLKSGEDGCQFKTGKLSKQAGSSNFEITYTDGSSTGLVSYEEAAKAVFTHVRKGVSEHKQILWPVSTTSSMADAVRQRRRRKEQRRALDESSSGAAEMPEVKAEPTQAARSSARTKSVRPARTNKMVKAEPIDTVDELDDAVLSENDDLDDEPCLELGGGPAVDISTLEIRNFAKDFPPGLPNVLWCALNLPEAQTGANFLRDMLFVHDSVPPSTMVQKLIDLMKYGPKAEGSSVHFKDPHRTELAAQYVYCLVEASSRLVRRDESALFGPSSWDDVEVFFSQSIVQTENMISGRRLAQGLQLSARGARLLSLMFTTELQCYDLYSTSSVELNFTGLKAMPTVRLVKSYGVRSGLKAAVRHTTKCLVRHSRWLLDQGGQDIPYAVSDE